MTNRKSFADRAHDHASVADSLDPQASLDDLEPLPEVIGDRFGLSVAGDRRPHIGI